MDQDRAYHLQIGPLSRFLFPGLVVLLAFITAGSVSEILRRDSSSPMVYLPIAVVAVPSVWLLLTTRHFGDLKIMPTQITRVGLFGFTRTVDRTMIQSIVTATVIDQGRDLPVETPQLLLIGHDGRCHLLMSADYDVTGLARDLGVPILNAGDPTWRADLVVRYPGLTDTPRQVNLVLLAGILVACAALLLVFLNIRRV